MNIYDLAETWFSEYHTIKQKESAPVVKKPVFKKVNPNLKGRKLNEHAYLWGQTNKKTTSEVCEMFNIKPATLRSWIKDNDLIKLPADCRSKNLGKAQVHRSRLEIKTLCAQAYEKMKNNGWSQTKVCAEYKLSNLSLARYIKKLNE